MNQSLYALCLIGFRNLNRNPVQMPPKTIKGNTKFWYGVMNSVQMNILEAYAILQYSMIVVAVEINKSTINLFAIPVWKLPWALFEILKIYWEHR